MSDNIELSIGWRIEAVRNDGDGRGCVTLGAIRTLREGEGYGEGTARTETEIHELPYILNALRRDRHMEAAGTGLDFYVFDFPLGEGTGFPYVFGFPLG